MIPRRLLCFVQVQAYHADVRVPAGKTLAILCAALAWQTKMKSAHRVDEFTAQALNETSQVIGSIP